ncbi:hypothetical protein F5Y04DRAFT_276054 [Hypomontagnella monticulosa]|nr:hypothetical protein F5Y04DRAFT_276054 [Hypomontagnella monticulosa]
MEALAALGVAAAAVQFFDFAFKAIDDIIEACQPIIRRLGRIFGELHVIRTKGIDYDPELLIEQPDKEKDRSKIKEIVYLPLQAMREIWRKPEIESLLENLNQLQSQLTLRILYHLSRVTSESNQEQRTHFDGLTQNYSDIIEVLTVSEQKLASVEKQSQYLKLAMDQSECRAMARDEKIIAALLTLRNGDTRLVKADDSFSGEYDKTTPKSIMTLKESRRSDTAEAHIGDFSQVFDKVLSCLFFRQIMDREETLSEAHQNTYDWIFCDPEAEEKPWSPFIQWLERGTGCYWISGKAGSGKSTLMKYVYHDRRTRAALRKWAGNQANLTSASFFFWNLGTNLQKSQDGLLRSILYDTLVQRPYLMSAIMPELLRTAANMPDSHILSEPNHAELLRWFRKLLHHSSPSSRFFFMIDGLDEFDGDHQEIINLIISSARNPNVKFLVSSRPIPACVDAFSMCPTLQLHDLTHDDIQKYVEDLLQDSFKKRHTLEMPQLVEEVVEKACGVFLWVVLVARSLLTGLRNYDNVQELRERLDELPSDLKDLYAHMLQQVPQQYRRGASELFQTVILATNVQTSEFRLSPLQLHFAFQDRELLLQTPIQQISHEEMTRRTDEIDGRLRSRSMGLLEVRLLSRAKTNRFAPGPVKIHSIEFIHKTAVEFLQTKEVWDEIIGDTQGSSFDAAGSLFRSCVYMCKIRSTDDVLQLEDSFVWAMMDRAVEYATIAENSEHPITSNEIEDLDKVMTHHWKSATKCLCSTNLRFPTDGHWTNGYSFVPTSPLTGKLSEANKPLSLDSLLVYHGLSTAMNGRAQHGTKDYSSSLLRDAVEYLFQKPQSRSAQDTLHIQWHRAKVCSVLLNWGADPNAGPSPKPWKRMLEYATTVLENKTQFHRDFLSKDFAYLYSNLLISFITHSADVNATVLWTGTKSFSTEFNRSSALSIIDELFSSTTVGAAVHNPFDDAPLYTAPTEISQFHKYITRLLIERGAVKEDNTAKPSHVDVLDATRNNSQAEILPAKGKDPRKRLSRLRRLGSSIRSSLKLS